MLMNLYRVTLWLLRLWIVAFWSISWSSALILGPKVTKSWLAVRSNQFLNGDVDTKLSVSLARAVTFVLNVIVINESSNVETSSTSNAWKDPCSMGHGYTCLAPQESMILDRYDWATFAATLLENDQDYAWKIHDYVQFCVHTKFVRCKNAWIHAYLEDVTLCFEKRL